MSDQREILILLGWRLLIALPLFAAGIGGGLFAEKVGGGMLGALAAGLLSTASILLGSIVLANPLARLIAEPWGKLFFSNDRFDKPQPRFSIPAARRREGKFEEAITGYAAIVEEHPEAAARAYIEILSIVIVDLRDAERADRLYLEALDQLTAKGDRELLATVYRDIRSRIVSDRHGIPARAPINTDGMHRSKPRA